jgi:hypothetical protein
MSKILIPGIAATVVALYFITRKRKVEFEFEMEPLDGADKPGESSSVMDTQILAE